MPTPQKKPDPKRPAPASGIAAAAITGAASAGDADPKPDARVNPDVNLSSKRRNVKKRTRNDTEPDRA